MYTIEEIRAKVAELVAQRAGHVTFLGEMRSALETRSNGMTTEERSRFDAAVTAIRELDEQRAGLEARAEDIGRVQAVQAEQERHSIAVEGERRTTTTTTPGTVNEPDMYTRGGDRSFFRDVFSRSRGDSRAAERLGRHTDYELRQDRKLAGYVGSGEHREARAASVMADFSSIVTPQFMLEDYAPIVREGRPLLSALSARPLPNVGNQLTIPRGVTGTLVGSQTTQNTAVATRTYTTTDLVVPVITVAGYIDLSFQALQRGGLDTDEIVMSDMVETYAEETNRQAWNGTGANNQHFGVLATTGIPTLTVTSTGATTQMRQLISSFGTMRTNRKRMPTAIFMHPRRWSFWSQAVDGNGRPLITPTGNGPFNAFGVIPGGSDLESRIAGYIEGTVPVILDANIPITLSYDVTQSSTTDPIFVTRLADLRSYEESPGPRLIDGMPDMKNLTMTFVGYNYSAFTAARYPSATIVLAGSGLTIPPAVG